jgi:hypothetical protein
LIEKFEPLLLEDKTKLELVLPKKTTVSQLKLKINEKISPSLLLVRVIGKYNQLERVLKNENYDLKKYNLESPINLFVEELKEPLFTSGADGAGGPNEGNEGDNKNKKGKGKGKGKNQKANNSKDNEMMIVLMQKNKKRK